LFDAHAWRNSVEFLDETYSAKKLGGWSYCMVKIALS